MEDGGWEDVEDGSEELDDEVMDDAMEDDDEGVEENDYTG